MAVQHCTNEADLCKNCKKTQASRGHLLLLKRVVFPIILSRAICVSSACRVSGHFTKSRSKPDSAMTRPTEWQKNAKESKQCIGPCHMAPEGQEILQTCCFTAQVKLDSEISEVPSRSRCNQPIRPSFGTSNPSSTLGAQWDLGGTPCQVQRTWRCSKR